MLKLVVVTSAEWEHGTKLYLLSRKYMETNPSVGRTSRNMGTKPSR